MDQLTNNLTSLGLLPRHYWYTKALVPAVVMSLCFLLGVPGNILVIILRPNWKHLSSLSQSLLLNLAIYDLLSLLVLPVWIYSYFHGWNFGVVACKLSSYVEYCAVCGSKMAVTGLSVQRYLLVVHRLECHWVYQLIFLVLMWLVPMILSAPALVVYKIQEDQQGTECLPHISSDAQWVTFIMVDTVFGFIFLSIVLFSYISVKRTVNQAALFNNPRTTRLITSIIVSVLVLWVPYHILSLFGVAAICLQNESLLKFYINTWDLFVSVTFINSCLNPLLYAFTSQKFCQRKELLQQNQRMPQSSDITTPV